MKMAKLRRMLTHPGKNESGQGVLAIVLLLLMLGAIILTPLLVFMSTGVKAGQVYESKLQEFYAADSGVEAAMCEISQDDTAPIVPDYPLNDRDVDVTIEDKGGGFYKINSTATSDTGGNTTIECYVLNIAGFNFFGNAITSNGNVTIKGNVTGNVTANGTVDNKGDVNGTINESATINWPSEEQLSTWYRRDVNLSDPFPDASIDIATLIEPPTIGPLYRDGSLDIDNTGDPTTLRLDGTVYITDDLTFLQPGAAKAYTIDLNGQTIYAEGDISLSSEHITVTGSGCIIAVGNVTFQPGGDVGNATNFVFIMSVKGKIGLQPGGDFYGAIAGETDVTLQPGNTLALTPVGEGDVNFPTEGMGIMIVRSYTIK